MTSTKRMATKASSAKSTVVNPASKSRVSAKKVANAATLASPVRKPKAPSGPGILAIDIGGSGLKAAVIDEQGTMTSEHLRIPTPHPVPPEVMMKALGELVGQLDPASYTRISVGFPGVVRNGVVLTAPNLGGVVWADFDLAAAISKQFGGCPTKIINDADMQGYALIENKGLELVLTLGTGFGSALYLNGVLMPHMELGQHNAHKKKNYDQYVGEVERERISHKRWEKRILKTLHAMQVLLQPERIHLGGGNAARLTVELPAIVKVGSNSAGLMGGAALWRQPVVQAAATKAKISKEP